MTPDEFLKMTITDILAMLKEEGSDDFLINIESDSILRSCFIICHSAYGDEQFDGEYCDQSCGYSEDDYHGVYYYPIGENLYFAYNYEC
ncbi:TPA: hypothetical protein U0613_001715 [Streptococcus suis]|nr:hypothetical protein [Streptococcus suis]